MGRYSSKISCISKDAISAEDHCISRSKRVRNDNHFAFKLRGKFFLLQISDDAEFQIFHILNAFMHVIAKDDKHHFCVFLDFVVDEEIGVLQLLAYPVIDGLPEKFILQDHDLRFEDLRFRLADLLLGKCQYLVQLFFPRSFA